MNIETAPGPVPCREVPAGRSAVNGSLLLGLAALSLFPLLMLLRGLDDNTLVSWRWAVVGRDVGGIFLLHACGVATAYLLSRLSPPRGPLLYAALFLIPAVPALLLWNIPEAIIDASRFFTGAKHLELYGFRYFFREWGVGVDAWTDLPLPAFLYGTVFSLFGESRTAVQTLNTALFSSTAILAFLIARLLWGSEAGLLAGLLFVGAPYFFTQVPLMLGDIVAMFSLTLSAYLTLTYIWFGGHRRLSVTALSYGGAFLCKYSLWPALFLLAAVVPAVKFISCRKREALLRGGALLLALTLLVAALFLWRKELLLSQMALLAEYQLSGLRRWRESHLSTFVFQVHPFVTLLAGYGAWHAFRKRDPRFLVVAFLPALAAVGGVRRIRYFMVLLPLLAVAASYGLCAVRDHRLRLFAAWIVVLFSAVTAVFLYRPFLQELSLGNLQAAARVLNETGQEEVDVFLSREVRSQVNPAVAVPLLDIYTRGSIKYRQEGMSGTGGADAESSPFRFSWRYRNPAYYTGDDRAGTAAAVYIGGAPGESVPSFPGEVTAGYERQSFQTDDGFFNYGTFVTVFLPPAEP